MNASRRHSLTGPLAETAERFAVFLKRHSLNFDRFAAHLRLDILSPREAWALRKFAAISGGVGTAFINDLKNNLSPVGGAPTIPPITASGTLTGTAVDMVDSDGPCFGFVCAGAISGGTTAAAFTVKYQEADTAAGTFADIAGATHATISAANKSEFIRYMRSKRFVRGVATAAGTSPTLAIAVNTWGATKRD
jgi:hypothetical protein